MCDRLQKGEYGQQNELALIACKYNVEIIVFENGTQQWIQKPTGTRQQKHVIALRWCRDSIHYDWLKQINSDEPKRVTPLPVSSKLGPNFTDANNSPLPTSQESNRSRQLKKKFSHCSSFMDAVWKWTLQLPLLSVTEHFTSRILQQLDSISLNTKRFVQNQAIKKKF